MESFFIVAPFALSVFFIHRWDKVKMQNFPEDISIKETFLKAFYLKK